MQSGDHLMLRGRAGTKGLLYSFGDGQLGANTPYVMELNFSWIRITYHHTGSGRNGQKMN